MSEMTLLTRFPKYSPSDDLLKYMSCPVCATRVDREQRIIEVDILSEEIIPKVVLYRIEQEILTAYGLNRMRIFPKYSSNLFHSGYIDDVIKEAFREASIAKGFFDIAYCTFNLEVASSHFVADVIKCYTIGGKFDIYIR